MSYTVSCLHLATGLFTFIQTATMSNTTFSFSGSIPGKYDHYLGPYIFEPYGKHTASLIKNSSRNILEIAAGTGRVTKHIAGAMHPGAQLTATDINPDMLEIAKEKTGNHHVTFQTADAQQLPFNDNSFDCAVCQFGYMFLPDKQKGFDEAFRVLQPGGHFIVSTWDRVEDNITAHISFQTVAGFLGNNLPVFYGLPHSLYNPDEIINYLETAGFSNISAEKVVLTGVSPTAMDIATGYVEGNPVINEITKAGADLPDKIKQVIVQKIHEQVSGDPVHASLSAWVFEAYK